MVSHTGPSATASMALTLKIDLARGATPQIVSTKNLMENQDVVCGPGEIICMCLAQSESS
jgi:hypothetical protein